MTPENTRIGCCVAALLHAYLLEAGGQHTVVRHGVGNALDLYLVADVVLGA